MEITFQFAIGDLVQTKLAAASFQAIADLSGKCIVSRTVPLPLMVIERIAQECHGGVQLQYRVRGADKLESTALMNELELERYVPIDELPGRFRKEEP